MKKWRDTRARRVPPRAQKAAEGFYRRRGYHLPRRDAETIAAATDAQLDAFGIPHDHHAAARPYPLGKNGPLVVLCEDGKVRYVEDVGGELRITDDEVEE